MILFLISTLRILCDCDRDCSGIYGGLFMLVMMYGWTLIDIKRKRYVVICSLPCIVRFAVRFPDR